MAGIINWNNLWMEAMGTWRRRRGDMTAAFWDRRSRWLNEVVKSNDSSMQIISKLEIDPSYTVLDIGAGPGTLTIPLAKRAKHVTVVEPSSGMLACLKENAANEGLKNITCINRRWEDVIPGVNLDAHDLVIASHSLLMLDMKAALSKMNEVAERCVYLFYFAGASMPGYSELWPRVYGEEFQAKPDYIGLYNILYEIGIYANVEISKTEHKQRFSSLDEAVEEWKKNLGISAPEAEEVIRSYLSVNLVKEGGAFYLKDGKKSVMIWWQKAERGSVVANI